MSPGQTEMIAGVAARWSLTHQDKKNPRQTHYPRSTHAVPYFRGRSTPQLCH